MRYDFFCPRCDAAEELVVSMTDVESRTNVVCHECGEIMYRDFSGVRVSKGHKQYHRQIISQSLAINPDQIPEHRRLFPDVQVTPEGMPVFDNFVDHDKYLEKCNIEKVPQKKKKRGKRIA